MQLREEVLELLRLDQLSRMIRVESSDAIMRIENQGSAILIMRPFNRIEEISERDMEMAA